MVMNLRPKQPAPSQSQSSPSEGALREAAEWRVRLAEEPLPETERCAFRRWLEAHSDNALAWSQMEATWDALAGAERPIARAALEHTFREESRHMQRLLGHGTGMLLLLLALLPATWLALGIQSPGHLLADHHTAVGGRKHVTLPDGSELILNTATAVDIDYRADRRIIHLRDGEIQVTVAPDEDRPLIVLTPEGRARALGTRFTTRRLEYAGERYTIVTVQESRVELCQRADADCVQLTLNQQARAGQHGLSPIETADAEAQAAWVRGQLVVDDQPLTQVLQTLGRHHRGLLRYDEASLADLQVSGVLPLDDIDRALTALAGSQPIGVRHHTSWAISVTVNPSPDRLHHQGGKL